jgi:hypothetical protein
MLWTILLHFYSHHIFKGINVVYLQIYKKFIYISKFIEIFSYKYNDKMFIKSM